MIETSVGNFRSFARSAPLIEYSGKDCAKAKGDTPAMRYRDLMVIHFNT